ncbi:MAG: ABC transporter permease [Vicinamibacterales bacterium]
MREALTQSLDNLRANTLRSVLTMFGVAWGMVSVIVLGATGEGFRLGNEKVLLELGRNIALVWGSRTSHQAGGERAGRQIVLNVDDARAIAAESPLVEVVSPELERGRVAIESAYNAGRLHVSGVEPEYQRIRTIEIDRGRNLSWADEDQAARVAVIGHDVADQLFGQRAPIGETIAINGLPYLVVGTIREKQQDSNYDGPDNTKVFVPFATMARDLPRVGAPPGSISNLVVAPRPHVLAALPAVLEARTGRIGDIDWPLERSIRRILARRHGFDPDDRAALNVWDTSLEALLFSRMIGRMRQFFTLVGLVTLALGGVGVMNIMLIAVRERTREIGLRKALGATPRAIQRQFFLEGLFLTTLSGGLGVLAALALCGLVNLAPMPSRFSGMVVSWPMGVFALGTLLAIGVLTSAYPARRAAALPPIEALRFEL